jgi:acyl-CoA synthetase (NDP forming)
MTALHRLFHPRSVAIIGASSDPTKLTGRPLAYLQKHGFAGDVYPVNPRLDRIGDLACYADVKSLPATPDVALVLLGADRVGASVRELAGIGTPAAIVLASGFGEAGEEGARRQRALIKAAGPMRLLGPNTIGMINVTEKIMLSASGAMEMTDFPVGRIALVSQSGGILGSLLSRGVNRGIGFSKLVATGNEADLEVSDFVDYLVDDDATSVIALYLEGIRHPDRFRVAARRAQAAGKPIVVFKVGRSESGARAAVSHTGALAGADRTYDAFFKQSGVIRAQAFSDLLDIPAALAHGRKLRGQRLAIVTTTGGAATLIADNAGMDGFDTPAPDAPTAERLRALNIRDAVLDRNPVDVTLAGLQPEIFRSVIDTLADSPSYDAIVVIVGASALGQPDLVVRPLIASLLKTDKPLLAFVSPDAPHIVSHLNRQGVPAYAAPEGCVAALSAMWRMTRPTSIVVEPDVPPPADHSQEFEAGPLNEAESKTLFARYGIPSVTEYAVATPAEAGAAARHIGADVVLKILSRHVQHKTEVGGVAVGIRPEDVERRCTDMIGAVRAHTPHEIEGLLVQEMIGSGVEVILGFHRDPQLGPTILLGMGGVAAELFNDTTIRLAPVRQADAEAMIGELKAAKLLQGYRGRPKGDVDALAVAIVAFSTMAMALGERLAEAEINPLFVLREGHGVRAADGLVVLRPTNVTPA